MLALSFILIFVPDFTFDIILNKVKIDPTIIYLIVSYCLGYVVYGLAMMRDRIIEKINFIDSPKKMSKKIKESLQYKIAVETLKSLWNGSSLISTEGKDIEYFDMRETRGAVMAYVPDVDTKIYTFMFRSELCNHLNVLFSFISILGLCSLIVSNIFPCLVILRIDGAYVIFYILAFFIAILLHKTRIRFLSISYNIPFTIFIARFYPIKKA